MTRQRARVYTDCSSGGRTKQEFAEDADINNIMRRFLAQGTVPHLPMGPGMYGDFSQINTYQDAVNAVHLAGDLFDALPSRIRTRFRNDPAYLVDFMSDDKNRAEAEKLGLITAAEPDPVPKAPPEEPSTAPEPPEPGA